MKLIKSHWRIKLLSFFLLMAALLLSGVGVILWRNDSQEASLRRIAECLGYDPLLEIAQVNRCWDVFSHCGLFLYYQTSSLEEELAATRFTVVACFERNGGRWI